MFPGLGKLVDIHDDLAACDDDDSLARGLPHPALCAPFPLLSISRTTNLKDVQFANFIVCVCVC